jgi:hypothetical protein
MNSKSRYAVESLATGIIVLILYALGSFWARWLCWNAQVGISGGTGTVAEMSPLRLVPTEIEEDPSVVVHSNVSARVRLERVMMFTLGFVDYALALEPGTDRSQVYYVERAENGEWVYLDRKRGLIVYSYTRTERQRGEIVRHERRWLYAGPNGVAAQPGRSLGRFTSPVVGPWRHRVAPTLVFDPKLRCFFAVNFVLREVVKGPQLDPADDYRPVQVGAIVEFPYPVFQWQNPMREAKPGDSRAANRSFSVVERQGREVVPTAVLSMFQGPGVHTFVLDATGRIDLLDESSLEIVGTAGKLPMFRASERDVHEGLLAYWVRPVMLRRDSDEEQLQHIGTISAAIGRDGTSVAISAFNERGSSAGSAISAIPHWEMPGGPALTIGRFLLENLHPPLLSTAGYFTAPHAEAAAGHRAMFLLSNSFIADKARDLERNYVDRFIGGQVVIMPSIILALFLGYCVRKSAQTAGLSPTARTLWMVATIAFGVPAYITYRLCGAPGALVTCKNCGLLRRPEMDACHCCGSPWNVPELTPPSWRVIDQGPVIADGQEIVEEEITPEGQVRE